MSATAIFPQPFTTVTGTGVLPEPVKYADDGKTAVTVKITTAVAGNLTVFTMSGDAAVTTPVAMTAGDEDASAADIAAAVAADFQASSHLNMVAVSRDTLQRGYGGDAVDFSVVTFTGAQDVTVIETRLVIQETGNTTDGTYYLMDAAFPGPVPPPGPNPGAEPASVLGPIAIVKGMYLWIPELESLHRISYMSGEAGGGTFSPDTMTHWHVTLDPVPATAPNELYAVLTFEPSQYRVEVRNVGGADATIDGQVLASGSRYISEKRNRPIVYDASGTTLEFSFDNMV